MNSGKQDAPLLRLEDIGLTVGRDRALRRVDLEIRPGEVHAVIGDHGAGKSALAEIIGGTLRPSLGVITLDGVPRSHLTAREAAKHGVAVVRREIHLVGCLTITENLLIPDRIRYAPSLFRRRSPRAEAEAVLRANGFDYDPAALVRDLSPSDRLVVSILRSVLRRPRLLVLDAVIEQLSAEHLEKILAALADLKRQGSAVLCLGHGVDEIMSLVDTATILRKGATIHTDAVENFDKVNLIRLCYSKLGEHPEIDDYREFYQLLRYNEAILQKLPVNLVVTDNENRIKLINDHGRNYFKPPAGWRNLPLDDLFGDETAPALIKTAFEEKREDVFYAVPVTVNGRQAVADIKTLPIRDGAFSIGNMVILEDISEQERLRRRVILSEKLASVGLLAAGVAHEINNPLEIIYNHLGYLKLNPSPEQTAETVGLIEEELRDIKRIVSNLITFSDRSKLVIEEFDLSELIAGVIALIRINARRKNIRIHFTPPEAPVIVRANKNEIKQVLLNLFKNSFEAAGEAGAVRVAAETVRKNGAAFSRILFRDDGCGVPEENPGDVFLPFYSTKSGKSGNEDNLGLGLSVSYGIVSKYGGEISVENLDGGGCEFNISLPRSAAAPQAEPDAGPEPGREEAGSAL